MAMFTMPDPFAEGRNRRGVAFICGLLAQVFMIGAAVFLGELFPGELPFNEKHYVLTWLTPATPQVKLLVKPPVKVARVFVPKPNLTRPPENPAPRVAQLEVPRLRPAISLIANSQPNLPVPPIAQPNQLPRVKEQAAVRIGIFGGSVELVTTKRPVEEVQTGGFGSPQGLPGQAQGGNPGNVPKLGLFALPDGPGLGNGTGGRHGIQGVVATVGFSNGIAGSERVRGGGGTCEPMVTVGGFEKARQIAPPPVENSPATSHAEFQPIEILSKPVPAYTEEARRVGIQGEVSLSVVFQANGAIRVTGVVRSLGYGLDQAAEQAATRIRFKPALRAGQPMDFPATLRIEFRLAGQST